MAPQRLLIGLGLIDMSLQNLPEDLVYQLLPSAIIDDDARSILQAVIGGHQDRLEDLRAFAKQYETFLDPITTAPEGTINAVVATLAGPQGHNFTRSLMVVEATPPPGDTVALVAWVAFTLGVDEEQVISAVYASDPLRHVDVNLLEQLAATLGAVAYKSAPPGGESPADLLQRQRQAVATYFPRLRVKGTAGSFVALGRLLGFADAKMTPLWGRASSRLPNDPGAAVNDLDFSPKPEVWPQAAVGPTYDPARLDDGPYYQWLSGTLLEDPEDPDFYTTVNGANPFVNVTTPGGKPLTSRVVHPAQGSYLLVGGGPHVKAMASPSGTGMAFQAVAEGASFNTLRVEVLGSGLSRQLSIMARLSALKYRTSLYNLSLFADLAMAEEATTIGVQPSGDLEANPTLASAGTAMSPFYPWAGTVQAQASDGQLDPQALANSVVKALPYFDEVRAATRAPRRVAVGYTSTDLAAYAAYPGQVDLFYTSAGTYYGQAVGHPADPYSVGVGIQEPATATAVRVTALDKVLAVTLPHRPEPGSVQVYIGPTFVGHDNREGQVISTSAELISGTVDYTTRQVRLKLASPTLEATIEYLFLAPLSGESSGTTLVQFSGTGLVGSYDVATDHFDFIGQGPATGRAVVGLWAPTTSEVVRPEPASAIKQFGSVRYQGRPEDQQDFVILDGTGKTFAQLHDEYAWCRSNVAGGELEAEALYQPPTADLVIHVDRDTMSVFDHGGAEYDLLGHDRYPANAVGVTVAGSYPIRVDLVVRDITAVPYSPGQPALAIGPDSLLYHVGAVHGVLVADPVAFASQAHLGGLVLWATFNEHPEGDLGVVDRVTGRMLANVNVLPADRLWDATRGWYMAVGATAEVASHRLQDMAAFSASFQVKPLGTTASVPTTLLSIGPVSWDLDAAGTTLSAFLETTAGVRQVVASFSVVPNSFSLAYVRAVAGVVIFGLNSVEVTAPVGSYKAFSGLTLKVTGGGRSWGLHDVRIWDQFKSAADMAKVRSYAMSATAVAYHPTYFLTQGRQDRYGLRALSSGFVFPEADLDVQAELTQHVIRYAESGRYVGDVRFKQVGLGGRPQPPQPWRVGYRGHAMGGLGRAVVATGTNKLLGVNALYDFFVNVGAGTSVSADTTLFTADMIGTALMADTTLSNPIKLVPTLILENPIKDQIWVHDLGGTMYEVIVDDLGLGPTLTATPTWQYREPLEYANARWLKQMHQPTGPDEGDILRVVEEGGTYRVIDGLPPVPIVVIGDPATGAGALGGIYLGQVYPGGVAFYGGSAVVEPPLPLVPAKLVGVYMYNASRVVFSTAGTTCWANRVELGLELGVPARPDPGVLSFLNFGNIQPGPHRLDVDASCIGNAGQGIAGFDVEVSIGPDVFPMTLLAGAKGLNPRATVSVEVDLTSAQLEPWSLVYNWLNSLDIPEQGLFRSLAIHSYVLRRLEPRLYQVVDAETLTLVDTSSMPPPHALTPGGWLATVTHTGTMTTWLHEVDQATRPENDTFTSKVPLSSLLTTVTADRRDELTLASYTGPLQEPIVVVDPAPAISLVATVSAAPHVVWLWAGGVTPTTARLRAKLSADSLARGYISTSPTLSRPTLTAVSMASLAGNNRVVSLDVANLAPNTTYYYAVGNLAGPDLSLVGTFVTFPLEAKSFTFALSGDSISYSNALIFDVIRQQAPLFFLHLGDMHYDGITTNSVALYRAAYDGVLAQPRQAALYQAVATVYVWDDHDYGGNNSDSTAAGRPAAQATFREYVPSHDLVASGPIYRAFACGRVRFIITDLRSERGAFGTTMLGSVQKAWFKQQLLDAKRAACPLVIWVSTVPWIGGGSGCDDGWCRYTVERQEIANFIKDNEIKGLLIVGADMHAMAADDGTNSDFSTGGGAGVPVLQVAPLDQTSSHKGESYSEGVPIPNPAGPVAHQFGLVTIEDVGGPSVKVMFSGRDSNNVEILAFSFDSQDSPKVP